MGSSFFPISVFLAGIISFFSPCIFPILPVYMGVLADDTGNKYIMIGKYKIFFRPIIKTLAFILGLSVVFLTLGFGAGAFGNVINSEYTPIIMGIVVIILGLHQGEFINLKFMQKDKRFHIDSRKTKGYLGAFVLGLGFSFGWTPCIGPVLSTVIAISATETSLYGLFLMACYSLGLAIPFIILSLISGMVTHKMSKMNKYMTIIKKTGGVLIILMGILLMWGKLNNITVFFS